VVEPEVALVFSPETWVEELHRYLADHGGARVRQIVMEPSLALDEQYDTLVVSHRWPALTRALVDALHARSRRVLGVFDPEEPAGREHLAQLGVDAAIAAGAAASDFVDVIGRLAPVPGASPVPDATPLLLPDFPTTARRHAHVLVVGGPPGSGATEIALELTRAVRARREAVVIVDADEVSPSLAPRLGLAIEPNLRTAVDAVQFGLGALDASVVHAAEVDVVGGFPSVAAWSHVRPGEVVDALDALAAGRDHVIVNVSGRLEDVVHGGHARHGVARAVTARADALVGVGAGTPVGITRLLAWVAEARALAPTPPVHLVVNRAPGDRFRRGEIADEVARTFAPAGLTFVPGDARVETAAWEAAAVARGPSTEAVAHLAAAAVPVRSRAGREARRRRRSGPR